MLALIRHRHLRASRKRTTVVATATARPLAVCAGRDDPSFSPLAFRDAQHLAGTTSDRERNRPAADGAVFDERLFALRSIDLQREYFAAMRARDFCFNGKFHQKKFVPSPHSPLTK